MPPTLELIDGALHVDSFYEPYPHQVTLHVSPAHNLLGIGGFGSGKSTFLLGEAIYVCLENPGADVLLLRRDYPELEKGLIHDFKEMVPDSRELYRYNDQKHIVTWFNGSKIFFGHLQESRGSQGFGNERALAQYLSSAFVFIGIDEIAQFSYSAYVFLSSGRNRINRGCQPSSEGRMPIPRIAGATNPMGPGYGWIKNLWIDKKPVVAMGNVEKGDDGRYYQTEANGKIVCVYDPSDYIYTHSTIFDNPAQLLKDPGYIERLQKMPPALRQKALYGDLNTIAGTYFANFTYERNIRSLPRDHDEIRFEAWQPRWLSMDWGLAHQTSVHWHTKALVKDTLTGDWHMRVVTYREKQLNDAGYSQLCKAVADMTPEEERKTLRYIFMSPDRFRRSEHDPAHLISDEMSRNFRELGLPSVTRANDRREDGAVFMYNLIESGDWIILDSCPILIRSIETRVHDDKKIEDVLKTDDELDDAYDDARYGLVSMLREKGKPEEVKIAEKIASIPDHTARMLYAFEQHNRKEAQKRPIKPNIVPRWQVRQ
jgi:hypothetical protein